MTISGGKWTSWVKFGQVDPLPNRPSCNILPSTLNFSINFCLRETAEALAGQVTEEHYGKGMIYPPFGNIRKISAHIAANVAAKAYELGEPVSSWI